MTWRVQQLTNTWYNVYGFDVVFTRAEALARLDALAASNPHTSFRAVSMDDNGNFLKVRDLCPAQTAGDVLHKERQPGVPSTGGDGSTPSAPGPLTTAEEPLD